MNVLATDNDKPIFRDGITLAHELARMCTSSDLARIVDDSDDPRVHTTYVIPSLAFIVWGRYWNVVSMSVHGGGWKVTGMYSERVGGAK